MIDYIRALNREPLTFEVGGCTSVATRTRVERKSETATDRGKEEGKEEEEEDRIVPSLCNGEQTGNQKVYFWPSSLPALLS